MGHAVLKAVIQGLTEFLPVSSTAHLIFTDALLHKLGWASRPPLHGEEEFYDILLHIGTLSAVLYYFRADLSTIFRSLFRRQFNEPVGSRWPDFEVGKLTLFVVVSTFVTCAFAGTMLLGSKAVMSTLGWATATVGDIHEFYMAHTSWVAVHLVVTGCLLFFTETYSAHQQKKGIEPRFGMKNALAIGLFQGFAAVFHGISRSGSTISGGLVSGTDRLTAARYSFLISIPVFTMAMLFEVVKVSRLGIVDHLNWPVMLVGMVVSAVVGYVCVKYFIKFVARNSLKSFAVYCWIVGIAMAFYFNNFGF